MTRHRTVALLVIVVGIALCALGLYAANDIGPGANNYDRDIGRAIVGGIAAVIGLVALVVDLFRGRRAAERHGAGGTRA